MRKHIFDGRRFAEHLSNLLWSVSENPHNSWTLSDIWIKLFGPRREKTCLRGFRQSEFQTSLTNYRDQLENKNFTCSKIIYDTFQKANNKDADQTARMRRLVCACVVRKPPKTGFLASGPKLFYYCPATGMQNGDEGHLGS